MEIQTKTKADEIVDWENLPEEVLFAIFSLLDERSLGRASRVCRVFSRIIADEMIWYQQCKLKWRDIDVRGATSWRYVSSIRTEIDKKWRTASFEKQVIAQSEHQVVDFLKVNDGRDVITAGLKGRLLTTRMCQNAADDATATATQFGYHDHTVSRLKAIPKSSVFVSASYDSTVKVWSTNDWSLLDTLTAYPGGPGKRRYAVTGLHNVPDSHAHLLARSSGGSQSLFDLATGKLLMQFKGHGDRACTGQKIVNRNVFFSSGRDGKVLMWDMRTGNAAVKEKPNCNSDDIYDLHVSNKKMNASSKTLCCTVGCDRRLSIWNPWEDKIVQSVALPEVGYCIKTDVKSDLLLTGGRDGTLMGVSNFSSANSDLKLYNGKHSTVINSVKIYNDKIVTGALDENLSIWSLPCSIRGDVKHEATIEKLHSHVIRRIRMDSFGIYTCGYDGKVIECKFDAGCEPSETKIIEIVHHCLRVLNV